MRLVRSIKGMSCKTKVMTFKHTQIKARITSDALGSTLSLYDGDTLLMIPLESLSDVLQLKRKGRRI